MVPNSAPPIRNDTPTKTDVNLNKKRRILRLIKQKYGRKISWTDFMILTGNAALEPIADGFRNYQEAKDTASTE